MASVDNHRAGGESYRLGRKLAADGLAEVYEATHPRLPGRYTIKMFRTPMARDAEALRLFRAEVEAVAALRHPNLLQVIEVGTLPDGRPFVVREGLAGETLAEKLLDGRMISLATVVGWVRAAAAGLQAAHGQGIVHRSLTADSLFIAHVEGHEHGFVKVADFGISRLRQDPADEEIDERGDQYALATAVRGMMADAPPAIEAVLQRALAARPVERYESVLAFACELEEALAGRPVRARVTPLSVAQLPMLDDVDDVPMRVPRNYGGLAVFTLALAAGGVGSALWAGWRPPAEWQQSEVWQALHLPVTAVAQPAPPPPAVVPVVSEPEPATEPEPAIAAEPAAEPAPAVEPAPTERARPVRQGRRPPRARDMVWSEQQQRLVPADQY